MNVYLKRIVESVTARTAMETRTSTPIALRPSAAYSYSAPAFVDGSDLAAVKTARTPSPKTPNCGVPAAVGTRGWPGGDSGLHTSAGRPGIEGYVKLGLA